MVKQSGWVALAVVLYGCGDDGGGSPTVSTTTTMTAAADPTTAGEGPTTTGSTGTDPGGSATDSEGTTAPPGTSTTGPTSGPTTGGSTAGESTTIAETTVDTEDTAVACEDLPELCDALDNNCNDLFDEGCDCTPPDLDLMADFGYTARVIVDVEADLGAYGRLGDVERAIGEYWGLADEGVLFTLNNVGNTGAGIGVMDHDGAFMKWVVDPALNALPPNPYLEYAYEGVLYACTTVASDWIYKVHPDGTVEQFVHHGNCEGLIYGDRGDGAQRLYASNWEEGMVYAIEADGTRTLLASGLSIVVDLALPRPGSAFTPGLYTINQMTEGVHRIAPDNSVTLDYPYSLGFGIGEEISFADPKSAFRDHFFHLSASSNSVERIAPDGTVETILEGPKLNYGLYTTGAVFSTNGAFYFFTNEDNLIMRLQACNVTGQ